MHHTPTFNNSTVWMLRSAGKTNFVISTQYFRVLGDIPNTYAYTKSLSEALVVEKIQSKTVPAIIVRPSIVVPIRYDPIPGWVSLSFTQKMLMYNIKSWNILPLQTDNINGPTGLLIGAGKGVIRSMYCNSSGYGDYLPVDFAVNGILVCSWNYVGNRFEATVDESMKVN